MVKNRKVVGAFLVGSGLVVASYIASDFSLTPETQVATEIMYVKQDSQIEREFISVSDTNQDGIEDWREEFITEEPLILPVVASSSFAAPTTVTDIIGIQMFESLLYARGQGGTGMNEEEIVKRATEQFNQVNKDTIYEPRDILTIPSTPEAIRKYANTAANIVLNNNVANSEDELTILDRAMKSGSEAELQKLAPLANAYKNMRDQMLATPVPVELQKQHLDLINVYQALFTSINNMQFAFSDPVLALMRIQRYQDDAAGLANALKNMYLAIEPYASSFTVDDPAVVFVVFAPNYQENI
jgi:hypothetical protein